MEFANLTDDVQVHEASLESQLLQLLAQDAGVVLHQDAHWCDGARHGGAGRGASVTQVGVTMRTLYRDTYIIQCRHCNLLHHT